jgi:hypothetical protein
MLSKLALVVLTLTSTLLSHANSAAVDIQSRAVSRFTLLPARDTANRLQTRDDPGSMQLCRDFGGTGDNCINVGIPAEAITDSNAFVLPKLFEINLGALTAALGGGPSAVTILTPALACQLSNHAGSNVLGSSCDETHILVNSGDGCVDSTSFLSFYRLIFSL